MASGIGRGILAITCLLFVAVAAGAAPPEDVTYQGRLLDSGGDPVTGPVIIEIGVWDQATGGTRLYGELHPSVTLEDGVFSILLGTGGLQEGTFDAALFADQNRYLQVHVDYEVLEPRQPFSSVAYALRSEESESTAYAVAAGDADTVDGSHAASLDQSAHVSSFGNPHAVTAADVGAVTIAEAQAHAADASAHHIRYADAEAVAAIKAADGSGSGLDADLIDGQDPSAFANAAHDHDTAYYTQAQVDSLVANLQAQVTALQDLLQHVSRSGDDIYVTGANLHVRSGSGATEGTVNGLGNLIVGYNELRGADDDRTGSHNLVVGRGHNYSSYGGLVIGYYNAITGNYSSVSGGRNNLATGNSSSVSGGYLNHASVNQSSVSGGQNNTASGYYASVSGGYYNEASGDYSSVSGGYLNDASGSRSSVSGGHSNEASGAESSVSGGQCNLAGSGTAPSCTPYIGSASVSGGFRNVAGGHISSVSGGSDRSATDTYDWAAGSLWEDN
jgi:hypothetical protein